MLSQQNLLISGATGKQGGAVIRALLADKSSSASFKIFALTRNAASPAAISLASTFPHITIIEGDLSNSTEIFKRIGEKVWGVFSVQLPGKADAEEKQGCALIDAAIAAGVEKFVYSSVDRGGVKSDTDDTNVPHFAAKAHIERHLKTQAAKGHLNWTILRPTAFFDNTNPGAFGYTFGALWSTMPEKAQLQFVSTKDIGFFAAKAFQNPDEFRNKAVSLAGDTLTFSEGNVVFSDVVGRPLPRTYSFVGRGLRWAVPEVGKMFDWFEKSGYDAKVAECRRMNPAMQDFKAWIKESKHMSKA